jgi:hypothetical protein
MRSTVIVLILALSFTTIGSAEGPVQLVGSVEAVYHEGLVTFRVEHTDAVSSSVKVFDIASDTLVYDSGPRAQTRVSWPAGHDLVGTYRYVVTAWNDQGEVVVSQAAVTKNLTPISNIAFDTIPGNTKLLGPNEVIVESDLQVGATQGVRLDQNINSYGGGAYFFEEDGTTTYAWMSPDFDGQGGFFQIKGSAASGGYIQAQGMDALAGAQASFRVEGTSDFGVYAGLTGNESVVLPSSSVSSFEIANEPGVASAALEVGASLSTFPANVAIRTITAPTSGYVFATAAISLFQDHTSPGSTHTWCSISDTSGTQLDDGLVRASIAGAAPSGAYGIPISLTRVFPVSAGPKTFYIVCERGSNGSVGVEDRHLDLIFIPTAYGTVSTTKRGDLGSFEDPVDRYRTSPEPPATQTEIDAERAESIAFNIGRIQAELAELQAQADALASPGNKMP